MHFSITQLVTVVAGIAASTTSAHSIHRRGAQHQHKDIAERMAASASEGDAANFYARALSDAQAGRYRIRRSADSAGKPGQRKVVRKRGTGATCKIRSTENVTASAVESAIASSSSAEATASASAAVNNWWASPSEAASSSAAPSSTWAASSTEWSEPSSSSSSSSYYSESSSSSSSAAPAATEASTSTGHGSTAINQVTNNVLKALDVGSSCGASDPTPEFPNGSEDWVNCGMRSAGGWQPPKLTFDDIRVGDATKLQAMYPKCAEFFDIMTQVSAETSVPAQLLLSIAIQESGCRKDVRGGGGEMGLMQAAANRCASGNIASCMEPYNNIKLGADIFNEKLSLSGGNVIQAIGMYNGWDVGMTYDGAHNGKECSHNRNRDYVHSIVNGYMQGTDSSGWNAYGRNGC
ncbi:hypothetical protein QFC24_000532 [Naganishia onofrii]|uniref:Uncharacterized protein n=1 Tax=Naganishia onofrii TaxID=1851511 RepID=A0ACC2XX37_9TREE|nr:hypothetical protein QFC24_000532 [Naganishia onofrii]